MLLLQRPTGTWESPAGRLQPGESFEEGAVRELYEETGILATPQRIIATWVGETPSGRRLASVTYAGRVGEGEVRLSEEHLDHRWVTLGEWMSLPSWWSHENIRRIAGPVGTVREPALHERPKPPTPPEPREDTGVVPANLGAGAVLVDLGDAEPRALLLRRRKPPVGLWENPGGMLEEGEDFEACASRELHEETSVRARIEDPWWARVEPWRSPEDPELYAGVGFLARHRGGEIEPEAAHDAFLWVTETEWISLRTWYTRRESDVLWRAVREMQR